MRFREPSLTEEVEYTGIWHMPDKKGEELHGTVKYTPSDIVLTVTGSFYNLPLESKFKKIFGSTQHEAIPIICGLSRENEKITLEGCIFIHSSSSFNGLETIQYRIDKMFIGEHFAKIQDIKFLSVGIHYAYINEWFGNSGLTSNHKNDKYTVIFKMPKPLIIKLDNEFSIKFGRSVQYPAISPWEYSFSMEQKLFLIVECSYQKHYSELIKIHQVFQDFFTLAFLEPTFPLMIHGIIDSDPYKKSVIIFRNSSYIREKLKKIYSDNMLFNFHPSHKMLPYLKKWYLNYKKIGDVSSLYFSSLYNPNLYLESQFETVIQALEAYHRIRFKKQKIISDSKYTPMIKRITNNIKKENDKKWFKRKSGLHVLNEPSLPDRLYDLIDAFPVTLERPEKEKTILVEEATSTRNYFAHHTEKLKEKAKLDRDLFILTQKLRIIMEAIFLKEVGFKGTFLNILITKNRNLKTQYYSIKF